MNFVTEMCNLLSQILYLHQIFKLLYIYTIYKSYIYIYDFQVFLLICKSYFLIFCLILICTVECFLFDLDPFIYL